ncbi:MAG: DNA topoisomerase [Planctomycetota bacterium]
MAKKASTTKKTAKKTAKATTKKTSGRRATGAGKAGGRAGGRSKQSYKAGDAKGKDVVIVESPSKAKTINKYLGADYVVLASVGHVRDLPSKSPKGEKAPVPGVDLEKRFTPKYVVLDGKEQVVRDLKRAAKDALGTGGEVWFATDLDREGEAIAWHLAQEIGIGSRDAKRVIFPAITKREIEKAFQNPHPIDEDRVNAQQARRILDRIVGYQVSPLLWKKVARGLSAGRVQSVAVRLVVQREREIRAFVPDEHWNVQGLFSLSEDDARKLGPAWHAFAGERDAKGNGPTIKSQNAWLAEHGALRAELIEVGGKKFDIVNKAPELAVAKDVWSIDDGLADEGPNGAASVEDVFATADSQDVTPKVLQAARLAGLTEIDVDVKEDAEGRGPARWKRTVTGTADPATPYAVRSIETKRTTSRPPPPFITSTMQQAASTRMSFGAQRTMRAAQQLYEGIEIPGEGPTGLITYMRTDSTHIAGEALDAVRGHIKKSFGDSYLPDKPNFFKSSNKGAQEAHEAIRPTDPSRTPDSLKRALKPDQLKLYTLIWERFVACQMSPAQWDATTVLIEGGTDRSQPCTFKATGRVLVFDGFYRVSGVPTAGDEANMPKLDEGQSMSPLAFDVQQRFTSPPARYTEASLIKVLESEGIGRPSTYAAIIQTIQDRKYVELLERRMHATDLGEVVTDKLIEAFPRIMDIGYTREMEAELDKVEDENLDWIDMLERFYGPFKQSLARAEEELGHAKAEVRAAPPEYKCQKCGSGLVYRFGKNGRFLSCSTYPDCDYACPCDRQGRPRPAEWVNVRCPKTGRVMVRRTGRFGPFITTLLEDGESQDVGIILNIDKKGFVVAPSQPPLLTDLPCPTCDSPLNLRNGVRGPWLGCSRFPKCRGRGKWAELEDVVKAELESQLDAHDKAHPIPVIETLDGQPLTDAKGKPVQNAPSVDQLVIQDEAELERLTAITATA